AEQIHMLSAELQMRDITVGFREIREEPERVPRRQKDERREQRLGWTGWKGGGHHELQRAGAGRKARRSRPRSATAVPPSTVIAATTSRRVTASLMKSTPPTAARIGTHTCTTA